MGYNPQKQFTKSNKTSNVENQVCCELVKLHTVYKKKPMKELVGRERKTAQQKSKEHHPKAALGLGDPLCARKDDLIVNRDEAISVSLVQILLLKNERHPVGCGISSVGFPHLVILCKVLDVHLRLAHGGYAGAQRSTQIAAMVAAAEARNW
jgi:hypothetical protein